MIDTTYYMKLVMKGHNRHNFILKDIMFLLAVDYYDYMSNSVVYLPWAL